MKKKVKTTEVYEPHRLERTYKETLEDILEWFENKGFIEDVHYDEQHIIDSIKEVLE
jgi:hypothetical protein